MSQSATALGAGCCNSRQTLVPSSPQPRTFPDYPSKFAQFGIRLLLVGEKDRLAWVMHCLPLAVSGITILVRKNLVAQRSERRQVKLLLWSALFARLILCNRPT